MAAADDGRLSIMAASLAASPAVAAPAWADQRAIERVLVDEAGLLDERRFEDWRDLFAEDGHYWVPLRPGQESPDGESSLFYDDRKIMATRFERLRHPNIHSQTPPHRTCRLIGNVVIRGVDAERGECRATSTLIMTDYRLRVQRVFSGHVSHDLRRERDALKIVLKKVELINCDDVFELIAAPL
jgi:ethylbenzene dioxygenase beta subunit